MAIAAVLEGFPDIIRMMFFQGSGAKPGRLVVDTMVAGVNNVSQLPKFSTLTVAATGFYGLWPDMKVVKSPRLYGTFLRTVLEDSRWKLRDSMMGGNFNRRNSLGVVAPQSQQSTQQLVQKIADATGLSITTGPLAGVIPPAAWTGRTALSCLDELLTLTGSRMVYNPVTQGYTVSQAGTGGIPDVTERLYRPGPPPRFNKVRALSGPVMYEDRMDAQAMTIDANGQMQAAPAGTSIPLDVHRKDQVTFRLWQPTTVTHPAATPLERVVLAPYRAASILPDAENPSMIAARVFPDEGLARWPHYLPSVVHSGGNSIVRKITDSSGGEAVLLEHPELSGDGTGNIKVTGEIVCAYWIKETNGELKRNSVEVNIPNGGSQTLTTTLDWILPVDSTESDMGGAQWDSIHDAVANAIANRYMGTPQTLYLMIPKNLEGSGRIGGVQYAFDVRHPWRMRFGVAIDFEPMNGTSRKL